MEAEAYEYFGRIERLGGVVAAIKENFFQREIAEASYRFQSEVEAGERVIVGVNRYQHADEEPIPLLRIDPALEGKQTERLQASAPAATAPRSRPRSTGSARTPPAPTATCSTR